MICSSSFFFSHTQDLSHTQFVVVWVGEAKKSLVGEDSDSEDEEFREAGPSYTGGRAKALFMKLWPSLEFAKCLGFGVQSQSIHALTSMSSDGRPLVEDRESGQLCCCVYSIVCTLQRT